MTPTQRTRATPKPPQIQPAVSKPVMVTIPTATQPRTKPEARRLLAQRVTATTDVSIPIVATFFAEDHSQTCRLEGVFSVETGQLQTYRFKMSWGVSNISLGVSKYEVGLALSSIPVGSDYDLSVRWESSTSSSTQSGNREESLVFVRHRAFASEDPFTFDVDVLKYSGPATDVKYLLTVTYRAVRA
jgi:hypothetical protein